MKQRLLLTVSLAALLLQSCLISRDTQNDLRRMDTRETYAVYTVRMPMFIARPIVKSQLKKEHASKELVNYVKKIEAVKLTIAATRPGFDVEALKAIATKKPYQNWITVNAYGNTVYINAAEKKESIRKINVLVAPKDNVVVYAMVKCRFSPDELSAFINLLMSDEKAVKRWMGSIKNEKMEL